MLDNEPTAGAVSLDSDTTTEKTTTRRRSASRPAGPPPEPDEAPSVVTVTAASATEGASTTGPAASGAPAPEPGSAATTAPAPAEPVTETPSAAEPAVEDKPKRVTRRRATAKATAAAVGSGSDAPGATVGSGSDAPGATAESVSDVPEAAEADSAASSESLVPAETAETAAPVRRSRTRRRTEEEEPAGDDAAPRRRRTRKDAAPERSSAMSAAEAEVAAAMMLALPDEEPLDDALAEDIAEDAEESAQTRVVADPFGSAAQQSEVPSVTFQAPAAVFQPLFQSPDQFTVPVRPQPAKPQPTPAPAEKAVEEDEAAADETDETTEDESSDDAASRRRRRRRGGRGRGRSRDNELEDGDADVAAGDQAQAAPAEEKDAEDSRDEDGGDLPGSRRRRRRRRRGTEEAELTVDDPPNTVVRIRAPRATRSTSVDEVQGVRGSTRLEAKKQRRREGRELGRRRPPIITESEFLARRESVERVMVVRRHGGRTQIAVLEDGVLVEHYVDREASQSYVGNVYLGKVQNVLPSMEAAFVDIGKGRNAVLYAGEVNFDTAGLEGQPKRIEAALKSGQSVLVQVTKDPIGHKGARLTSQISLPGRYLVYVPDGSMTGISRKLPDKERTRLKQILRKVMPENAGVIVRTAAEGASEEELSRDVARLSAQWEAIQRKAKSASPPELLSAEPDMTVRVVRDVFNEDFVSLVVEGEDVWQTVDEYVRYVAPHLADRLSQWEESADVFAAYRVDEQIAKAMERKVWLPSGGSLVIDRTEAMTVVDVNTGKFTGQGGNLEETVTRNNLEAAEEIVRQLRLRDVGGIIVIDFIDMVLESNRDLVLRRLLECLARDRTKHQVAEVTSLGLVQMTRKRVGQGLLEAFSTPCDCCHGRGIVISTEPVEPKPEPRGTQGKMAIEKAVAEKVSGVEGTAVAASANGRDSVTDPLDSDEVEPAVQPRGRRRSRRKPPE